MSDTEFPGPREPEPEYVAPTPTAGPRRRRRRPSPRWRVALLGLGVIVVVVVGLVAFYEIEAHPFGGRGPEVTVEVGSGGSADSAINTLSDRGVIGSAFAFKLGDLIHGTPVVQPGDYAFYKNESFSSVRSLLAQGPNVFAVDVRPGFTLSEVAAEVDDIPGHSQVAFLGTARSGAVTSPFAAAGSDNLEGLLGTGEYTVVPGESDTQLLRAMVTRFDKDAASAGLPTTGAESMSAYDVVTIASIVEKEGYIPSNMPDVSRVIYNRLAKGQPLQMNSTVLYSLGQDGGPVTPADDALNTPYNTYLHTGLTPTPICFPSLDALRAAVAPPPGGWLYFVLVEKNGTEAFSDTYAEQLANEQLAASRGVG
jgi:UPF0755 protein